MIEVARDRDVSDLMKLLKEEKLLTFLILLIVYCIMCRCSGNVVALVSLSKRVTRKFVWLHGGPVPRWRDG